MSPVPEMPGERPCAGRALFHEMLAGSSSRAPRGELWIAEALVRQAGFAPEQRSLVPLSLDWGADLCFFSFTHPMQALPVGADAMKPLTAAAHRAGQACGVTVDGPFERLVAEHGFMEVMAWLHHQADGRLREGLDRTARQAMAELQAAHEAGADLLILCDDIAYGEGLYFSPTTFASALLPLYRQLAGAVAGARLGFHADGKVGAALPALCEAGYRFYSLEPEAMDLPALRRTLPRGTVLLSGIQAEWLFGEEWGEEQVESVRESLAALGHGGGLILGSCCGLTDARSRERLAQIYRCQDLQGQGARS